MAEAIGLAASLLGIASVGVSIVSTLSKFKDLYFTFDHRLDLLSAKVSITSSILTQLGNTLSQYEKEFHLTDGNFQKVKQTCSKDFEKLRVALRMVKPDENITAETPELKPARRSVKFTEPQFKFWDKFKWAIGGADQVEILMISLESSKSNLQLLLESTNFFILKKLDSRQSLTPEMAEDLGELMKHVPALVVSLQKANLVPPSIDINSVTKTAEGSQSRTTSASRQRAHLAERVQRIQLVTEIPDITDSSPSDGQPTEIRDDPEVELETKEKSIPSLTISEVQNSATQQVATPSAESYKGWLIEWSPQAEERSTIRTFCGISFSAQDYRPGKYLTRPYTGNQSSLRAIALASKISDPHETLSALPSYIRDVAYTVLMHNVKGLSPQYYQSRDRFEVDNKNWELAAIVPDVKRHEAVKTGFWASKSRDPHDGHDWLLVLKEKPEVKVDRPRVRVRERSRSRSSTAPMHISDDDYGFYEHNDFDDVISDSEEECNIMEVAAPRRGDNSYIQTRHRSALNSGRMSPPQQKMSQDEAEKMMEAFLATFTATRNSNGEDISDEKNKDGGAAGDLSGA